MIEKEAEATSVGPMMTPPIIEKEAEALKAENEVEALKAENARLQAIVQERVSLQEYQALREQHQAVQQEFGSYTSDVENERRVQERVSHETQALREQHQALQQEFESYKADVETERRRQEFSSYTSDVEKESLVQERVSLETQALREQHQALRKEFEAYKADVERERRRVFTGLKSIHELMSPEIAENMIANHGTSKSQGLLGTTLDSGIISSLFYKMNNLMPSPRSR
jgi:chromosome segregation ATPase